VRIAYGVHGYGRGHATRVLALLPALAERNEVLAFAGGDAFEILASQFPVERIPYLAFDYRGSKVSRAATVASNAGLAWDLFTRGPRCREVEGRLAEFRPDVVVSDSEPLVLRAAARIGVPRIGFDHVGVIAHCRPRVPLRDRLQLAVDGALYRLLIGKVDRAAVSSFYEAPPRRAGVRHVPPVLRERVLRARPFDGDHLLVYFNNGAHLYTSHVDAALQSLGHPVVVYGAGREGKEGNVVHKPIDEAGFVKDLASSLAVLATGGHQLISEAIFLGKPMLIAPESSAEQRLNAHQVEALGVGMKIHHSRISGPSISGFLARRDGFRKALSGLARSRSCDAVEALESLMREVTSRDPLAPRAAAPGGRAATGSPPHSPRRGEAG